MTRIPCYHVTVSNGDTYGAAATTKRDAMQMTQDRLTRDGIDASPVSATYVGRWDAPYGTVLWY